MGHFNQSNEETVPVKREKGTRIIVLQIRYLNDYYNNAYHYHIFKIRKNYYGNKIRKVIKLPGKLN